MRQIGIRELRQNASEYVSRAEAGETIQVTDRGRPVALLVPQPQLTGLAALEAEGRISRAKWHIADLGPPLPRASGTTPLGEILAELRADER